MGRGGAWFGKKDRPAPHFIIGSSRGYQAPQGPVDPQLAEYTANQNSQPDAQAPPDAAAAPAPSQSETAVAGSQAGGRLEEKKISLYPQVAGTESIRTPFPSRNSSLTGQIPGAPEHGELLSSELEAALRSHAAVARDGEKAEVVAQSGVQVVGGGEGGPEADVVAEEEVLITIPGAMVHLIDGEASLLLTLGDLRVVRLTQQDNGMLAMVKVGDDLSWPLGWDEPVFKVDSHRYVFTLQIPENLEEDLDVLEQTEAGAGVGAEGESAPTLPKSSSGSRTLHASGLPGGMKGTGVGAETKGGEVMSYGVTLPSSTAEDDLQHLDLCLQEYSVFSEPQIVAAEGVGATAATSSAAPPGGGESQGPAVLTAGEPQVAAAKKLSEASAVASATSATATSPASKADVADAGALVPSNPEDQKLADQNAAYWTTVAPNVNDYRTEVARGIAQGSGGVIHGIFYVSEMAAGQLQRVESYALSKLKPGEKAVKISPGMMRRVQHARRLSRMTDRVASGILGGVVTTSGFVTGSLLRHNFFATGVGRYAATRTGKAAGKVAMKMIPGEVAVVSLDAFSRLFDAVDLAGRHVLNQTSIVTTNIVSHKYGEQAGHFANEGLAATGHMIHTAWSVSRIQKAFAPKMSATGAVAATATKTQALKGAVKGLLKK